MNIGIFNVYQVFNYNNNVFNPDAYGIGDDLACGMIELKHNLEALGHTINTLDQLPIEQFDKIIFMDYPTGLEHELEKLYNMGKELYLILYENPMIKPDNYNPYNHKYFKNVFTWWDFLLSLNVEKYRKIFLPISHDIKGKRGIANNVACMINSNKDSDHVNSKYHVRKDVINYYSNSRWKDEFDLYGQGWDMSIPVYKGVLKRKYETLNHYRFCYAMENAEYSGYVTEKPFDAMKSLCIPIYFKNHGIPDECYINFYEFESIHDLHKYLRSMAKTKIQTYQENIIAYLTSSASSKYGAGFFAKSIVQGIFEEEDFYVL